MERMFVVRSISYGMESSSTPLSTVDRLGFSLIRLMPLSGGAATGVRAELNIQDQQALTELAEYYAANDDLYWRFTFGGGARPTSARLRFTKFDRLSGRVQLVRTAVLRDLIAEVDPTKQVEEDGDPTRVPSTTKPARRPSTRVLDQTTKPTSITDRLASIWPKLFG